MIENIRDLDTHKLDFHLEELLTWKKEGICPPVHLDIGPAGGCVNRCVHCYLKWYGHQNRLLSQEVMDNIIEDGSRLNLKSMFLAGSGEPLLNPYTPRFIVKAKEYGIDMAMATGGVLLDEKTAEMIVPALNWLRFNVLAFSREVFAKLHGCPEDYRDKVFHNIEKVAAVRERFGCDIGVGIGTCVLPDALEELEQLISFAKEAGVDYISLRPVSLNKRNDFYVDNKKMYDYLLQHYERWEDLYADESFRILIRHNLYNDTDDTKKNYGKCYGINFINQIDADSGVYACGSFVGDSRYLIGNLQEQSYAEIMMSPRRKEVMEYIESMPDIDCCDDFCRCHNINKYLWRHKNPPRDVNFI